MTMTVFGKLPDQREVHVFTLVNNSGVTVQAMEYGATITSIRVPDRRGKIEDIALGCDSLEGYIDNGAYLGAVVGRCANRIGGGCFELDGRSYRLTRNEGENHLHGGSVGFDKVLWRGKIVNTPEGQSIVFQYVSPDGEEGYPGTAILTVTYTLTMRNELCIRYEGTTEKPTILNPTQHTYFNLTGDFTKTILGHRLRIMADKITPVSRELIPTGKLQDVAGTPFDFRTMKEIGARIEEINEQLVFGGGYNHNWVLRGGAGIDGKAAELYEPESGRMLMMSTDQPGLQFYSGNLLNGSICGKDGIFYNRRAGLCLEAQTFPDSPNKPDFPQAVLRPGAVYRQTTTYRFSAR